MSGVGKSSVLRALAARGMQTVDTDEDGWCVPGSDDPGERVWDEDRMRALLGAPRHRPLFVSGCVPNQGRFSSDFAHVVLLSAPPDVTRRRILARSDNPFGQSPAEWARVVADTAEVVPLLRRHATLELDTAQLGIDEVADRLAALAAEAPSGSSLTGP